MAEIGAFLFPYFLREGQDPLLIPVSAVIGIGIALVLGLGLYWANKSFTNKAPLAAFMSVITGWLATGLFTGGMHEFEEAVYYAGAGPMTPRVFEIPGEWAAHWRLPMTIFKPFGYSKYPTVLMMVSFWSYAALTVGLHYRQWYINKKNKEAAAAKEGGKDDAALSQTDGAGGEPRAEAEPLHAGLHNAAHECCTPGACRAPWSGAAQARPCTGEVRLKTCLGWAASELGRRQLGNRQAISEAAFKRRHAVAALPTPRAVLGRVGVAPAAACGAL
eukprot:CAMPEP_0206008836 /NCGR_PEP_ID=MMETSP1464-20131121/8357_1 /ASSEMBLY_ACC=CAM_ASM_001124 /TAXON_ID=119497 /ORGANISM="Exanthemachrysis gayraliae, Strain RCC1523" /LENGTH=274 /DNA_ID=CAMNT_0053382399 /DNA_START=3 /DNA_END=828 /DNA_ORIENTATION=+